MKTSLYLPFTNFKINNIDGNKILYETLVQSGPAYKLVVHESPFWLAIKDEMPKNDMIEIISNEKGEEYKELVNRFFAPVTETIPHYYIKDEKILGENLTLDLRRALSYILIAHDYKARIFQDDILRTEFKLSEILKQNKDISEDLIKRVDFVEKLINGYKTDNIDTISINMDARIFQNLMYILDKEEISLLSEKNHLFGIINIKKNILKRKIKENITKIIKHDWFPYLIGGTTVSLHYIPAIKNIEPILSFLSTIGAFYLNKYDFKEYAPPIQNPKLFELGKKRTNSFSYTSFNYKWKFLKPGVRIHGLKFRIKKV